MAGEVRRLFERAALEFNPANWTRDWRGYANPERPFGVGLLDPINRVEIAYFPILTPATLLVAGLILWGLCR
jgi:hypothetical protein